MISPRQYTKEGKPSKTIIEIKLRNKEKWYPLFTKSRGDENKTFNQSLIPGIQRALGAYQPKQLDAEIAAKNAALQDLQKQEKAQRKALQQAETKAAEEQRLRREMDAIRGRIKDVEDRRQELENTQGPLDKDAIQKLKDEKRKLAADHQAKRKQFDALAKAAQQAQKLQQEINKTILSKGETERRLGQLKGQKTLYNPLRSLSKKVLSLMNTSPKTYVSLRMRTLHPVKGRLRERDLLSSKLRDRFCPSWGSTPGCSYLLLWPSSWKGFSRRGVHNNAYHSKYTPATSVLFT